MNTKALQVYRHLLRVQRICFKDDLRMRAAALDKTRSEFELYRNETDSDIVNKSISYAKEVAKILEQNIVQAIKKDEVYELQLNDSHEINDNDDIRKGRTKNKQVKGCCGGK